jgi:hypothetical protein
MRPVKRFYSGAVAAFLFCASVTAAFAVPFHVTYLWHMHQPIYWPKSTSGSGNGYEKAKDTMDNAAARGNQNQQRQENQQANSQ